MSTCISSLKNRCKRFVKNMDTPSSKRTSTNRRLDDLTEVLHHTAFSPPNRNGRSYPLEISAQWGTNTNTNALLRASRTVEISFTYNAADGLQFERLHEVGPMVPTVFEVIRTMVNASSPPSIPDPSEKVDWKKEGF